MHGVRPVIPPKANRKNAPACDFRAYKDRNRTERMFDLLKHFRRVATRYDKTRKSFSAFLAMAAPKIWLPCLVNRTYLNGSGLSCGPASDGARRCFRKLSPLSLMQ
ncbi:transposase [Rhizobium sp. RU36D]|uniref:transposase n=1 Tax=Rhizobium sp. RU36D TaxID=1907415 RepID=UPI001FCD32EF|nr:transposase [Rhizobium sp. RU36D]